MLDVSPHANTVTLEDEINAGLTAMQEIAGAGSKLLKALFTQYTITTLYIVGEENAGGIPKSLRLKQVDLSKKLFKEAQKENLFSEAQLAVSGIIQAIDIVSDQGTASLHQGANFHHSQLPPSVSQLLVLSLGQSGNSNLGDALGSGANSDLHTKSLVC